MRELLKKHSGYVARQAALADAGRPDQRQQAYLWPEEELSHPGHLAPTPDEWCDLDRQVVARRTSCGPRGMEVGRARRSSMSLAPFMETHDQPGRRSAAFGVPFSPCPAWALALHH